jgi:putative transposase
MRQQRNLQPGFSYHLTTRCNNREFNLARRECREVFLYAIKKALDKYGFKLYKEYPENPVTSVRG